MGEGDRGIADRKGGDHGLDGVTGGVEGEDSSRSSEPLREIRMVPCKELESYGFGATFGQLVKDGFPGRGSYKGDFETF